jgi:tetratricopeptide (TPR) repeat protein
MRPEFATTLHKQIAYTYSQEKNYAKVMEHLQKVLDAEPGNVEVKTLMALEAIEGGMLEKGLEILNSIDPAQITSPDVYFNVGVKFRNVDKAPEAVEYFTKAIGVDAGYVDGYMQRGLTYLGMGKTAEAKADFQKVIELAPDGPNAELAKKALESLK